MELTKEMIDDLLLNAGFVKEKHLILGEEKIRWHKGGFEFPEEMVLELASIFLKYTGEVNESRKIRETTERNNIYF